MTTPSTPGTRDRDVAIAKRLGWRVEMAPMGMHWKVYHPSGKVVDTKWQQKEAWDCVPHYSTNLGDAAGLLVHVMGLGWQVHSMEQFPAHLHLTRISLGHDLVGFKLGESALSDPQAAWCAAVSEAALKALESEVGDGVD
jgi:hypothetical protein